MGSKMLWRFDRVKCNKRNSHGEYCTQNVKHWVGYIDLHVEFIGKHDADHKDWNQVDNEAVTTPSCNHVEVLQCACDTPKDWSSIDSFDPQVKCVDQCKNGNSFIIVRSCNTATDIWGNYRDEKCWKQRGFSFVGALFGEKVGWNWRDTSKYRRQEHTNVSDVHRKGKSIEWPLYACCSSHKTRVNCTSDNST